MDGDSTFTTTNSPASVESATGGYVAHLPARGALDTLTTPGASGTRGAPDGPRAGRAPGAPGTPGSLGTTGAPGDPGSPPAPGVERRDGAAGRDGVDGLDGIVPSAYLQYLPTLYQADPFVGRFLRIIEDVITPIERSVDTVADSLDPRLAPEEFLPWLASWVGLELDENWSLEQRREVIVQAATLYRWRGTRRGLREHLRIYTRRPPLIVENFTGLRLGQDAVMGVNTRLGEYHEHSIYVTVVAEQPAAVDERVLRRIIESDKPAHVGYTLEVRTPE
ncbi:MAG: phage tail protein [Chloroflexota bacterium]